MFDVYCNDFLAGIDLLVSTFEICDLNSDGLTKEELLVDNCKETLENLFGISEEGLDEIFPELDGNTDGRISLDEGRMAYERAAIFDRSKKKCEKTCSANCSEECGWTGEVGTRYCDKCDGKCKHKVGYSDGWQGNVLVVTVCSTGKMKVY